MVVMEDCQDKGLLPVLNHQIRPDDYDETSSGYSSRGSHNGDVSYEQRRAAERRESRRAHWISKDTITNFRRETNTRLRQTDISREQTVYSRGTETDFEGCTCGAGRDGDTAAKVKAASTAADADWTDVNAKAQKHREKITCNSETQTVGHNIELRLDRSDLKLIELLKESNRQLEDELQATGNFFGQLVKDLESQLAKAELQVGLLKEQLRSIEASKLKLTRYRSCGCSSSEEFEKPSRVRPVIDGRERPRSPPETTPERTSRPVGNFKLRKAQSADSLLSSPKSSLLKGKDPARIKQALLERNKALRKEIEVLKTSDIRRASSSSCLLSEGTTSTSKRYSSRSSIDQFDLAMEQVIAGQTQVDSKNTDRMGHEHTKWKQVPKTSHGRKKSSSAIGPGPSAFRTINVKSWGQTGSMG